MENRIILLLKSSRVLGIILFSYLSLLSITYAIDRYYQPVIIIIIGLLFYFIFRAVALWSSRYSVYKIAFVVILLGIVVRLLWVAFVPTEPFSDFLTFHQSAIKLANGNEVYYKSPGYTLLLSYGYRLYPENISGKLVNVILSSLSLLLLYLSVKNLASEKQALLALTLLAVMPSDIAMISVLGTDTAASFFGVLILYVITIYLNNRRSNKWILLLGLFYGLSLTIRSSFAFYLPVIVVGCVWAGFPDLKRIGKSLLIAGTGILIGLLIIIIGYFVSTGHFSTKVLQGEGGERLSQIIMHGTNLKSDGMWSKEVAELVLRWPAEQSLQLAIKESITKIKSDPTGFLLLIPRKMFILWGPNNYGNYWSQLKEFNSNLDLWIALFSQSLYVIVMLGALFSFLLKRDLNKSDSILLLILLLTFLPHIVLEVQPRYHHHIMPFLILCAADGLGLFFKYIITISRPEEM